MFLNKTTIISTMLLFFSLSTLSNSTARVDRYWSDQYNNYLSQYPNEKVSQMLRLPEVEERIALIQEVLSFCLKQADEAFIQDIAQHTEGFNILQVKAFMVGLANASKGDSLNREVYHEELEYLRNYSVIQTQKNSQAQLINTLDSNPEQLSKEDNQYPLLKDVYHGKKQYFTDAAKQLKGGQFRKEFRQGMLLYGLPGVGKGEIVEAMKNESDCEIIRIKASELVERFQGTGASAIKAAFKKAKMISSSKGVIVFIDELQSLCPVTTDANIDYAYKYEGKDYKNTLSQIWTEYDECSRRHKNILIVATCNDFELIDKRIRERFKCVEFPYPDETGIAEILKNKAQYFNVPMTKSDFEKYKKKMNGMSGRKVTTFVRDTKTYINNGADLQEALEQAYNDQLKAIEDGHQKGPSTMDIVKDYSIKGGKIIATGALMYVGGTVVGPAVVEGGKLVLASGSTFLSSYGITIASIKAAGSTLLVKAGITSTAIKTTVGVAVAKKIVEEALPEPLAEKVKDAVSTSPAG